MYLYPKTRITFLVIALLLLVGLTLNHFRNENNFKKDVASVVVSQQQPVQHTKDKNGYDIAYIEQHYISREVAEIMWKKKLDSVAKANHIKPDRITDYSQFELTKNTELTGTADPKVDNDIFYAPFTLIGDGVTVNGEIKGTTATGKAHVTVSAIERTCYWDRNWFLGDHHFYESIKAKDTGVVIDSMMNIHIAEAELSRWSISAFVGYDLLNMRTAAGLSLNYDLLRFKKRKNKVK